MRWKRWLLCEMNYQGIVSRTTLLSTRQIMTYQGWAWWAWARSPTGPNTNSSMSIPTFLFLPQSQPFHSNHSNLLQISMNVRQMWIIVVTTPTAATLTDHTPANVTMAFQETDSIVLVWHEYCYPRALIVIGNYAMFCTIWHSIIQFPQSFNYQTVLK